MPSITTLPFETVAVDDLVAQFEANITAAAGSASAAAGSASAAAGSAQIASDRVAELNTLAGAIQGPQDARKRFVVNSAGSGYELAARSKQFIVAYSQSNLARKASVPWLRTPPDNLFVYNGGNWNGNIAPPMGTGFVPASSMNPQLAIAYAAEVARENPETDFYLVIVARGGTGIRALTGIRYVFSSATSGAPSTAQIRLGGANSQVVYSEVDLYNYTRFIGNSDLGSTEGFYPARIQTTLNGGASWIEFHTTSAAVDSGTYRTQSISVTGSANWPPANGADVTVFPAEPRMRSILLPIIFNAMTAAGLTGESRKIDKLLIWPTEADVNYISAYEGRDFDYILNYLESVISPATSILMTLPWPHATGIDQPLSKWWEGIRRIAAAESGSRTLVTLSNTRLEDWTDDNNIHVSDNGLELIGTYLRRSENTGGVVAQETMSNFYSPNAAAISNVTTVTPSEAMWQKVGSIVTVNGVIQVSPTTLNVTTDVKIPLPIPSDIKAQHFLAGSGSTHNRANTTVSVIGDSTDDSAVLRFTPTLTGSHMICYTFSYRIAG